MPNELKKRCTKAIWRLFMMDSLPEPASAASSEVVVVPMLDPRNKGYTVSTCMEAG